MFGSASAPDLPYSRENISELAMKVLQSRMSVTGVQAKLSLDIDHGIRGKKDKLTIVGLWGHYILKPQSEVYTSMPELEDLTMKMAKVAGIETVRHSLIRMADGELAYITKRIDRGKDGERYSMLDLCQLSNRLTEHKYRGSYNQLADTIKLYSAAGGLDVQKFWTIVVFSFITGNSDMHCKNFSLIDTKDGRGYTLSPAYDLLAVLLTGLEDSNELAMTLTGAGVDDSAFIGGYNRASFMEAMQQTGIPVRVQNRIIDKLTEKKEHWFTLIDNSFLSEDLKNRYKAFIRGRLERLSVPEGELF